MNAIKKTVVAGLMVPAMGQLNTHCLEAAISNQTTQVLDQKMDPVLEALVSRSSGYDFDSSKPVSHDQLQAILEAGRMAPSSYNEQPWYFIVCDRSTNLEAYEKVLSTLVEFNQNWAKHAPVLIISIADTKSKHSGKINRWSQYDTGAAAFSIMIEATALGMAAHQMGGFDEKKIRELFAVPDHCEPMAVMAIGYSSNVEGKKKKERKPLSENFFEAKWGSGFH